MKSGGLTIRRHAMPFTGISYKVKQGNDDAIASIFSPENFQRVDSPIMRDADGEEIGYPTSTGLFLAGGDIVRVIQHDGGTVADIRRHMSAQEGVRAAERQLMPYLAQPRDTQTAAGFMAHFDRSRMTMLDQQQVDNRPAAGLLTLRYSVVPGTLDAITRTLAATAVRLRLPADGGPIIATLLLARDDTVVRVVQYDSRDDTDAVDFLAKQQLAVAADRWLAPYPTDDRGPTDLAAHLAAHRMRCVSHLSAAVLD
jgi:SchA/CurD like domain